MRTVRVSVSPFIDPCQPRVNGQWNRIGGAGAMDCDVYQDGADIAELTPAQVAVLQAQGWIKMHGWLLVDADTDSIAGSETNLVWEDDD